MRSTNLPIPLRSYLSLLCKPARWSFSKLTGSHPFQSLKNDVQVFWVVEAGHGCDFGESQVGIAQQFFNFF